MREEQAVGDPSVGHIQGVVLVLPGRNRYYCLVAPENWCAKCSAAQMWMMCLDDILEHTQTVPRNKSVSKLVNDVDE